MSVSVWFIRTLWAGSDRRRDAGLTTPAGVERRDNISYGPDGAWNLLDVYRPKGAAGLLPTVVSVHGGAYVYGDKDRYQFYCMPLAELGCGVVNFNYHLAPRYSFPAPLRDLEQVLLWLARRGADFGLDRDKVFLIGDSAGAQIASQYGAAWSNPDYGALLGLGRPGVAIRGLGLNCGMYQLRPEKKRLLGSAVNWYIPKRAHISQEVLDVLGHIGPGFPPTYLMSAPGDFLADHCMPMAALLREQNVPTEAKLYGDKKTGHVFHLDIRSPLGRQANREELGWLLGRLPEKPLPGQGAVTA